MWASLSPQGSELAVAIAAWSTAAAGAMAVLLFLYTLVLRRRTIVGVARREAVVVRWRGIFAAATLSRTEARGGTLPRYRPDEASDLLEEWNRARESVQGDAVANLIVVGERLGLNELAAGMLRRRRLSTRLLGVQTLGHLRDRSEWGRLVELLEHPNTALSLTAARALIDIDARSAAPLVMPQIIGRADWPPTTVSRLLEAAGPDLVTQPLCNAILVSEAQTSVRLLKYAGLARSETVDLLIEMLLRERDEPSLLAAAMKALSGSAALPRIEKLARHDVWYVRMQAAKLLGRLGDERDVELLNGLLTDAEWWVRYRAAQAIVALPFMGPNRLRELRNRQRDHFAADMLTQAMAEAGLA
jgi:HEAT repeat protein